MFSSEESSLLVSYTDHFANQTRIEIIILKL